MRAVLVTCLIVASVACGGGTVDRAAAPEGAAAGEPAVVVRAAAVRREGGGLPEAAPAELRARERATLSARTRAAVTELPFAEGHRVGRGDVVARLDDRALRAAEEAARTAVESAEADVGRIEALEERNAATPQEVERARAGASAARAQLDAAREAHAYAILRAPFDGRVARRPVDVGDVVGPGTPVLVVEGDRLELVASVDSAQVGRLAPGQELEARVDGHPEPLTVRIRSVAPSADSGTHRFDLRADVPAEPGLRAGVFARLLLEGGAAPSRLLVPGSALVERGGLTGVFVVEGGRARLRWIAAGAPSGDDVEVRAGLEEGERVVVSPGGLTDGRPVREAS